MRLSIQYVSTFPILGRAFNASKHFITFPNYSKLTDTIRNLCVKTIENPTQRPNAGSVGNYSTQLNFSSAFCRLSFLPNSAVWQLSFYSNFLFYHYFIPSFLVYVFNVNFCLSVFKLLQFLHLFCVVNINQDMSTPVGHEPTNTHNLCSRRAKT